MMRKGVSLFILAVFLLNTLLPVPGHAQVQLFQPGQMVSSIGPFKPLTIGGVRVFADDPMRFDFILDTGDGGEGVRDREEAGRLIRYFLASVTIPEKDMWVNLSPYEKDRIVPGSFGQTEMGRDLLEQDYLLKQIMAGLLSPDGETGKVFWAKVYARMWEEFGTTDIPVDTFNKVWIVPEKARVFTKKDMAYVVESRLKVMLETDYEAMSNQKDIAHSQAPAWGEAVSRQREAAEHLVPAKGEAFAKDVLRQVVIPVLEIEVNEGRHFARLRQIYNSLVLATWFKRHLQESILGKVYMDRQKIRGVDIADKQEKEKIWAQYVEAFKQGAEGAVKEEADPFGGETHVRKYVSGGIEWKMGAAYEELDAAQLPAGHVFNVAVRLAEAKDAAATSHDKARDVFEPLFAVPLFRKIIDDVRGRGDWRSVRNGFADADGAYSLFDDDVWDIIEPVIRSVDALSDEDILKWTEQEPLKDFNAQPKYQEARTQGLQVYEKAADFLQATTMHIHNETGVLTLPGIDYVPAQLLSVALMKAMGSIEIITMLDEAGREKKKPDLQQQVRESYLLLKSIEIVDRNSDASRDLARAAFDPLLKTDTFRHIVQDPSDQTGKWEREYNAFSDGGTYSGFNPQIWDVIVDIMDEVDAMPDKGILDAARQGAIGAFNAQEKYRQAAQEDGLTIHHDAGDFLRSTTLQPNDTTEDYIPWQMMSTLITGVRGYMMMYQRAAEKQKDERRERLRAFFRDFYVVMKAVGIVDHLSVEAAAVPGPEDTVPAVKGGIDLDMQAMPIEEGGAAFRTAPAMDMTRFEKVQGFFPLILGMTAVSSLDSFLGEASKP